MKFRFTSMALLVVSLAAFGCGESDESGETAGSAPAPTAAPVGSDAELGMSSEGFADSAIAASPNAGLSESADIGSAGALPAAPSQRTAPSAAPNGASEDSFAGEAGAAEPSLGQESFDDADAEVEVEEEVAAEEMQWIQLSTDDSTSMASAQIYKSNQGRRFGLKAHEFINYYDAPNSLFLTEGFPASRDVTDSIRFGIKGAYVAHEIEEIEVVEVGDDLSDVENEDESDDSASPEGIPEDGEEEDFITNEPVSEIGEVEPPQMAIGEFEVLFQMQADTITTEARRNWNLFFCVDVSGSMSGDKMEFTIDALLKSLEHLKAGDRLTLTTFNNEASNIFTDLEFTENEAEIRSAIEALTPGGGTNMTAGLEQSYRLAQQNFDVDMLQRVILFGDGAANVGRTDLETFTSLTRINGSEGIYLSGVGVGSNYDFERMDELTDAGKGAHIFLPNRDEVDLIFGDYFHKIVEVAADGIEIEASLPTGIALAGFSGEEVSFNPQQRLQNIVLATGDDMTFTARFDVLDEAALDEPMSLKVTLRPLSTDEEVVEIIEVDRIRDIVAEPGRLFERTRLVHRFGTFAASGAGDLDALRADLANYVEPDWGIREIMTLLGR